MAFGRACLLGDAAFALRPHAAVGLGQGGGGRVAAGRGAARVRPRRRRRARALGAGAARARPGRARAHAAGGRTRAAHRRVAGRRAAALGALRDRRLRPRLTAHRGARRAAARMRWSWGPRTGGGPVRGVVPDLAPACHPDDTRESAGPRSWLWTAAPSDLLRAPGLHSRRPKALPAGRRHRVRCTPRAGRSRRRRRLRRTICGRALRTRRRPRGPRHAIDVVRHGAVRHRSAHEATV